MIQKMELQKKNLSEGELWEIREFLEKGSDSIYKIKVFINKQTSESKDFFFFKSLRYIALKLTP